MYLKHMSIAFMVSFCFCAYTMQQEQSVAARVVKNILCGTKETGSATKSLVHSVGLWAWHKKIDFAGAGLGNIVLSYMFPREAGSTDEQKKWPIGHDLLPGRFNITWLRALGYYSTGKSSLIPFPLEVPKEIPSEEIKSMRANFLENVYKKFGSTMRKRLLASVSCEYATDVMQNATICLLAESKLLPVQVSGPLMVSCFVSGFAKAVLHDAMKDWFLVPCMRFGACIRKFGFCAACNYMYTHPKGSDVLEDGWRRTIKREWEDYVKDRVGRILQTSSNNYVPKTVLS
jgi:hypothetical protein